VLAVRAPTCTPSNGLWAGHVQVYQFNSTSWNELSLDIDTEAVGDFSGWSVSFSSNGSVLTVGANSSDPNGCTNAGHVWVYKFNCTGWTQLTLDIDG
jgi:hypothetical protein